MIRVTENMLTFLRDEEGIDRYCGNIARADMFRNIRVVLKEVYDGQQKEQTKYEDSLDTGTCGC